MNYYKLLVYFILGFIINIFLKSKNIEGFNFDILSAPSYPDLFHTENLEENLETTYNINSKKILIKILESNISTFSAEQNQDLKNAYFKATIVPQMPEIGGHGVLVDVYSFKGIFRLSDIVFLSPELYNYNSNSFLSSILIPGLNFKDYQSVPSGQTRTNRQPHRWWSESIIAREIQYRREVNNNHPLTTIVTGSIRGRYKNSHQGYIVVKNPKNSMMGIDEHAHGYIWVPRNISNNIYKYIDSGDPNDNFTIQIISYLDEDSDIIKNDKEIIKKYIYSQFFSTEQPQ